MGGAGAWAYAAAHPERLAASMPVCGASVGSPALAARLPSLPVRAFHAWDDDVVPQYESATWVGAIAVVRGASQGNPMSTYPMHDDAAALDDMTAQLDGARFVWRVRVTAPPASALSLTEYRSGGHAIMGRVYGDPASWDWLFAQRRGAIAPSDPAPAGP